MEVPEGEDAIQAPHPSVLMSLTKPEPRSGPRGQGLSSRRKVFVMIGGLSWGVESTVIDIVIGLIIWLYLVKVSFAIYVFSTEKKSKAIQMYVPGSKLGLDRSNLWDGHQSICRCHWVG